METRRCSLRCILICLALRAAVLGGAIACCGRLPAQAFFAVDSAVDADPNNAPKGFAVLKADSKVVEMIEDFDRYAGKKSWELAFRALNSIDDAKSKGMVAAADGFMVPIRARVRQSLLKLPPEGRDAYRLFNDAVAKQLWQHVQDTTAGPVADELPTLRKLVDQYFLTSVGDLAADRLGDALFEQGEFSSAEQLWRSVVENFPDSRLSSAKLQVKRCAALARLGRREAVAALAAQIADQFPDQRVTVGGKEVVAADFAKSLIPKEAVASSRPTDTEAILLPTVDEPVWQIRIVAPSINGQIDPNTGMPISNFHVAPSAAVEGNRLYANWLGVIYAADLQTGKMLWRTGKFNEAVQPAMNSLQQGIMPDSFALKAIGGKLLVLRPPTKNVLGEILGSDAAQNVTLAVECLEASTGKTVWRAPTLDVTITSAPFVFDEVEYLLGISTNNSTLQLVALDIATGRLLWRTELGTPQNPNNMYGGRGFDFGGPKIAVAGGMLYIATNNGALLAVGLDSHRVEWALQHDTKPVMANQRFWWNGMMIQSSEAPGTLLENDGVFYLKDASARLLYALDPTVPAVKWKRPISADESLATIDGETAYLVGHEVSALDLKSKKLLWSTKLPTQNQFPPPLACPEHLYVPTARGIFDIDPANGDIRRIFRGADRDSGAARLLVAGDKLIAISDTAVTAYSIQRTKPARLTSKTDSAPKTDK